MPLSQSAEGCPHLKLAYLGWGSLLWDKRELPIVGEWLQGGPALAIEFARISNDGRLTLVINEEHGAQVATRYARSACDALSETIERLRQREGKPKEEDIGFFDRVTNQVRPSARKNHPQACDRIKTWAEAGGWDAVVWTALVSNFSERRGEAFSPEAAYRYFDSLTGDMRARATKYIEKAPPEIDTPFRRLFVTKGLPS